MDPVRFGLQIRALRRRRGWTQLQLATAAGTSQTTIWRLEGGRVENVPCGVTLRVATALGARLVLELRWHGEGLHRLLDEGHADLVEQVVRLLRRYGWETAVEVSFQHGRESGSIDVLGWNTERQALLAVEVKSVVPDEQQTHASLDPKARLAPLIGRERGWTALRVGRLLVIGESGTARRRVSLHAATFGAAFPSRGRTIHAWLRDPGETRFAGLLFLPFTHRVRSRHRIRHRRRPVEATPRSAKALRARL
ncbi:hypothetical protein BH20CHL6_BH20CHL6_14020 [soil metagenome]